MRRWHWRLFCEIFRLLKKEILQHIIFDTTITAAGCVKKISQVKFFLIGTQKKQFDTPYKIWHNVLLRDNFCRYFLYFQVKFDKCKVDLALFLAGTIPFLIQSCKNSVNSVSGGSNVSSVSTVNSFQCNATSIFDGVFQCSEGS